MNKDIKNMNSFEFIDLMLKIVDLKFHEQFPEYFIRCKTLDKKIYDSANKSGYSYYIRILNAIKHGCFENSYKIDDYYEMENVNIFDERKRLLNDLNTSTDIRIWCFNNIEL